MFLSLFWVSYERIGNNDVIWLSSNFVEEDGKLPFIKENVIFGFIANEWAKVFANNTMPISSVFLVKLFLDVFGHKILDFEVINCIFCLYVIWDTSFIASAIISELSGMSILFSFLITSVICNLKLIYFKFNNHRFPRYLKAEK